MKKSILIIVIFLFSTKNILANEKVDSYSFFYEEDGDGALILYYQNNDIFGQIISYGGYKWFKATYTNSDNQTSTFIQPSNLGI